LAFLILIPSLARCFYNEFYYASIGNFTTDQRSYIYDSNVSTYQYITQNIFNTTNLPATNITSGEFGSNYGGGNYTFPEHVEMDTLNVSGYASIPYNSTMGGINSFGSDLHFTVVPWNTFGALVQNPLLVPKGAGAFPNLGGILNGLIVIGDQTGYNPILYFGNYALSSSTSFTFDPVTSTMTYAGAGVKSVFGGIFNFTHDVYFESDILAAENKTQNIGSPSYAFDNVYADDFINVASESKSIYLNPSTALNAITKINSSTEPSLSTGYNKPNYDSFPSEIVEEYKVRRYKKTWSEPLTNEICLKLGTCDYINRTEIVREVVPMSYKAVEGDIIEIHHSRSLLLTDDYLIGAVKALKAENDALKSSLCTYHPGDKICS